MKRKTIKCSLVFSMLAGVWISAASGQDTDVRTIRLGDFQGRPTVQVGINGAGPFEFILDTGSPSLVIDDTLAKELGLKSVGTQRVGAPGSDGVEANVYDVTHASIDGVALPVSTAIGINRPMMRNAPLNENRPRGVMSFWRLGDGVVTLDMESRTLTVDPSGSLDERDAGTLPLSRKNGFPFPTFDVVLGTETLEAHIDTGSPSMLTVDTGLADRLNLKGDLQEVGRAWMVGREVVIKGAPLDGQAIVGGITLDDPEIKFIDRIPGVNVGSALLQQATVSVDQENDLIRIAPHE